MSRRNQVRILHKVDKHGTMTPHNNSQTPPYMITHRYTLKRVITWMEDTKEKRESDKKCT